MDDLNFPGWRPERSIQVVEADGLTRVLMKGQLYMSWRSGDEACVRLAIVQLHQCGLATEPDLAEAFGRHVTTVQRYLREFADEGMKGLVSERRGPKGRWKLTPRLRGKTLLIVLREGVWGLEAIQQRLMEAWREAVSVPSIQQVLEDNGLGEPINQGLGGEGPRRAFWSPAGTAVGPGSGGQWPPTPGGVRGPQRAAARFNGRRQRRQQRSRRPGGGDGLSPKLFLGAAGLFG